MARTNRADRQRAERRGRRAETLAALHLRLKGYRILARRVRNGGGEIDLVARRGQVVAFVEVKQRRYLDSARQAVSPRNWQRIARAAELWMANRPALSPYDWRYDLVTVQPFGWPRHHKDFWRP